MANEEKTPENPWFSTSELLEYLGITSQELDAKKDLFAEGFHFIKEFPENPDSRKLWRLDRVSDLLSIAIPPLEEEAMYNALCNRITCQD